MNLLVTPEARARIDGFLHRNGIAGHTVRLAVVRSSCMGGRGHSYSIEPVPAPASDDVVVEQDGLKVAVDPKSAALLDEVRIERVGEAPLDAIVVQNSHAVGRCRCGHHDIMPDGSA